jgi:hypothetical protein
VLVELLRNELPAPSAADVAAFVTDARLAAWLHEPHLVQVLGRPMLAQHAVSTDLVAAEQPMGLYIVTG